MLYVKKFDGTMQKYDASKLKRSLVNSGADNEIINKIMAKVDKILYDGIETKKLFRFVFNEFKKHRSYTASRYNLKNAILRLGIEGFAFEGFVSKLLKKQGYSVRLNRVVKGRYILHEIDVSARKNNERIMVECKHRTKPWLGCHIQTALYVYARYLDVKKTFTAPMLVTNTKFSGQVIKYSRGVGLMLMGWKFPRSNSLEYNIEKFRLYPITMLSSLSKSKIDMLLNLKIFLISDLSKRNASEIANMIKITESGANRILEESRALLR
jgi:hypothetical protein